MLDASDVGTIESLSEDDPARALIANILKVVSASSWSFARFKAEVNVNQLLTSSDNPENREKEFRRLRTEFVLQRHVTPRGPRMGATIAPLTQPFLNGIVLLFADQRRECGILMLLRTASIGKFTSVELRTLALALDASSSLLSKFLFARTKTQDTAELSAPEQSTAIAGKAFHGHESPEMCVLDTDLNIVLAWSAGEKRRARIAHSQPVMKTRLPAILEKTVHELTSSWTTDPSTQVAGVAVPLPFLVVRTQPLHSLKKLFIGVILDRLPRHRPVLRAAEEYALSSRESELLALLLDGDKLSEICERMYITSSTAQDHIKSLISKTNSRNRSEMIAKVLGWESTRQS